MNGFAEMCFWEVLNYLRHCTVPEVMRVPPDFKFRAHPPHGRFSVEGLRNTPTDQVEQFTADPRYGRFLVEALSRTTNHNVEHVGEQPLYDRFWVEALSGASNHKVGSFFCWKKKIIIYFLMKKASHFMIARPA